METTQVLAKKKLFISKKPVAIGVLKVLIVDDDSDDVLILKDLLHTALRNQDFQIESVSCYKQAIAKLVAENYDLCFVDYILGAENGLYLLSRIKQAELTVPVVFVSGQEDERVAVAAIEKGAEEYLLKSELNADIVKQVIFEACLR